MTSIADAYVDLHVNGDNIEGEVRESVRASSKAGDKEAYKVGSGLGDRMGGGLLKGFKKRFSSFGSSFSRDGRGLGDRLGEGFISRAVARVKEGGAKIGAEIKKSFKGFSPKGLLIPALGAAIPFLTSSLSALSGALVAFTGSVAQAVSGSVAFLGVIGALIQAKIVASLAFKDFGKAVGGDEEALAALSPAARDAAKAAGSLTKAWGGVRAAVQQNVFKGLDSVILSIAKTTLPVLRTGFAQTGTVLNRIFKDLGGFVTSRSFVERFGTALKGNNTILATLGKAARPLLNGILNVFLALQPAAGRLAEKIRSVAQSFSGWSSGAERAKGIDDFMKRAFKSAGNLWGVLRNLGGVLRNVFGAATGPGDSLMATLNGLTKRLRDFTDLASTRSAIAEWAETGIQVSGRLFNALGAGFKVIQGIFNPDLANSYMDVFSQITPVVMSVVKVFQTALGPVIDGIAKGFAENGPKFAALFSALGPLLKGIGAVIGQVISQSLDLLGTIAGVITPVVKIISDVLGPVLERLAPIIAAVIVTFAGFAARLVSFIPIVGKFLAPLVKLAGWLLGKVGPAFKVLGGIVSGVFRVISGVLTKFFSFLAGPGKAYFNGFTLTIRLAMQRISGIIKTVWGAIKTVFSTVLRVISTVVRTYFNVYRAIITTVFRVIATVVRTVWNGIRSVITGVLRVIRGAVSSALNNIKGIFSSVFNAVKSVTTKAMSAISSAVTKGVTKIVDIIKGVPKKIIAVGASMLNAGKDIGKKVIDGIQAGLNATGGLLADIGSKIKSAINSALNLPITIGKGPLKFTIPAFAKGTIAAPGGRALVGERGPEYVDLPRGSKVHTANSSRNIDRNDRQNQGPAIPRKVILRVGARDFVGFIEEIADDRIDAAESLVYQGA